MATKYLRKNSKIVKSLFTNAKAVFVLRESHSTMDDSFEYSDKVTITASEALERFNKWYSDVGIRAKYDENDNLISVEIGEYKLAYWSDRMYVSFEEITEEQKQNVAYALANPSEVPSAPTDEEINGTAITAEDIADLRINDLEPKVIEITTEEEEEEADPLAEVVANEEARFMEKMREIAAKNDLIKNEVEQFEAFQDYSAKQEEAIDLVTFDMYEEARLSVLWEDDKRLKASEATEEAQAVETSKAGISSVLVEWSESGLLNDALGSNNFEINKEIPFAQAEELFKLAASEKKGSYYKTKVVVKFSDGGSYAFRLDLNTEESSIEHAFKNRIQYALTRSEEVREWEQENHNFWVNFSNNYEIKQA